MKEIKKLKESIEHHLQGETPAANQLELARLIDQHSDEDLARVLEQLWENYCPTTRLSNKKSDKILSVILDRTLLKPHKKRLQHKLIISSIAATILIVIGFYSSLFYFEKDNNNPTHTAQTHKTQPNSSIRNITLADGSIVILQKGSTLRTAPNFNRQTREVFLLGEAYFDVKHNRACPFIIHTSKATTTVLGTAFSIEAWQNTQQTIVTVCRGRVQVASAGKKNVILKRNQKASVTQNSPTIDVSTVDADKQIKTWISSDMDFDHVPLAKVLQKISIRYNTEIKITDKELAQTSVVTSFDGTEDINEIIQELCKIVPGSYYRHNKAQIIISKSNKVR